MLIVVDEDIPFAGPAFSRFGEVKTVSSGAMTPHALRGADALIVRSVTKVNAALLDASGLTFVGTATAIALFVDGARVPIYLYMQHEQMRVLLAVLILAVAGALTYQLGVKPSDPYSAVWLAPEG